MKKKKKNTEIWVIGAYIVKFIRKVYRKKLAIFQFIVRRGRDVFEKLQKGRRVKKKKIKTISWEPLHNINAQECSGGDFVGRTKFDLNLISYLFRW